MAERGLKACQPRAYKTTIDPDPDAAVPENLVGRDFTADQPGVELVGDITYPYLGRLAIFRHGHRLLRPRGHWQVDGDPCTDQPDL